MCILYVTIDLDVKIERRENMKKTITLFLLALTTLVLVGCTKGPYNVRFLDYDHREISSQTVEHGDSAVEPDEPSRIGYYFTGWSHSFDNVTGDIDIRATYEENEEQAAFNELLDSILNATQIRATTSVLNSTGSPIQTFIFSREDYVVKTSITGNNPINLYMNYFEDEYIGYEYRSDNQCWLRVGISEYQFNFINVNHANTHMLPDRIELEWFTIEDNVYTLKSDYFDIFKTRLGATGSFRTYELTVTEEGLRVEIDIQAGFEKHTFILVYTNIGTNKEAFPTDMYTCSE